MSGGIPVPTRRSFLGTSLVGGAVGFFAPGLFAAPATRRRSAEPSTDPRAQSLIHLFLPGGIAQQESFDAKPAAPIEYRGPLSAIPTKLDGVFFSQHFRRLAQIADRMTVCRALTHGEAAHERGTHNMFTGYRPSPAIQYPSLGSVVAHELGSRNHLPPYVCVPGVPNVYAGSGYLSSSYSPFALGSSPERKDFAVRDLELPKAVDGARDGRRRALLAAVDQRFADQQDFDALDAVDSFYEQAYALIDTPSAREAFRIEQESQKLRERYGNHAPGQRLLLARRLVEAGVRYVSVSAGSWDHHQRIEQGFRRQAPQLDQALSALITDLDQRGLLENTLVMVTSEFGRTPKINKDEGRDHWPRVFSGLLAGGGVRRGVAYGRSDPLGAEPADRPLTVEELAATVYHLLGIDWEKELVAPGGRPIEIVKGGRVVEELLV